MLLSVYQKYYIIITKPIILYKNYKQISPIILYKNYKQIRPIIYKKLRPIILYKTNTTNNIIWDKYNQ
jgi:hypothetical protein